MRLACLLFAAALAALPFSAATGAEAPAARRIALSFDDAPCADGAFFTGAERTRRLVAGLEAAGVQGALVFATTSNLDAAPDGAARLRAYAEAGHAIGNHSHAHPWLRRSEADAYLADVRAANERLSAQGFAPAFFRYPFLDEGKDAAQRDAVRDGLSSLGLRNGYVTVDNYDWYLDVLAAEALAANPDFDRDVLRRLYVEVLVDAVRFYDGIGRAALGRSPAHVLLLHENDLAALFIADLVAALRADGWQIIPAAEAYEDPIATSAPDTLFNGQGRVAALARVAGRAPHELVHPLEDEAALRELFVERGLLPAPQP